MSHDQHLNSLLLLWQERREQGQESSPEELCRDCPELLADLKQRILVLDRMRDLVQANQTTPGEYLAHRQAMGETLTGSPAPDTPLPAPDAIPGYEILAELGRGGMGVVYQARQTSLNRLVALKMILAGEHAGSTAIARFLQEAETIAGIRHANVVQVFDFGSHAGRPYFSMEFVDGGSLADRLKGEPQSAEQAARLVETLAGAMQAAHEQGVIHRDLKPANVLLTADGTPKITDFGLAKRHDSAMTASGALLGTPSYIAPEQAEGKVKEIGPPADIYSLGAILYELLTGRPPFRGASVLDTIHMVIEAEPVPPSRLQVRVPHDLETICMKCLEKPPARRYASAGELAEDLRRFQAHEPIRARPVGLFGRGWRWCRRYPVVAALLAVLVVVISGGLAGLTALYLRAEDQRLQALRAAEAARTESARAEKAAAEAELRRQEAETERKKVEEEARKTRQVSEVFVGMFKPGDLFSLQAMRTFNPGSQLTARDLLDRAADAARKGELQDQPSVRAAVLDALGESYRAIGLHDQAQPLLEEALALRRKVHGEDHLEVADSQHTLGWLYHDQGRYGAAEPLFRKALATRSRLLGDKDLKVAQLCFNLGWLLADLHDHREAEELFKRCVAIRTGLLGEDHREVVMAQLGLLACYVDAGKYQQAFGLIGAAKKLAAIDGPTSLGGAVALLQDGIVARHVPLLGGPRKSVELLSRCLDITRKGVGDKHPVLCYVLHELARAYEESGDDSAADKYYRECLDVGRGSVGLGHPKALVGVTSYCRFLVEKGRGEETDPLFVEVLDMHRRRHGKEHSAVADALVAYSEVMHDRKAYDKQRDLLVEALIIYRKDANVRSIRFPNCLHDLAIYHYRRKDFAAAEPLLEETVGEYRRRYGAKDANLARALGQLASARLQQGKPDDVEALLIEARGIVQGLANPWTDLGEVYGDLGLLYRKSGRSAEAVEAAQTRRKTWPRSATQLFESACNLAQCIPLLGAESSEGRRCAEEAVQTLRQAQERGFKNSKRIQEDQRLDPLRGREDFQALVRPAGK